MDIAACVHLLIKDAVYTGSATIVDRADWESREWKDRRTQPTWEQIEAAEVDVAKAETEAAAAEAINLRLENYKLKAARELALIDNDIEAVDEIDIRLGRVIREITP